jgi:F0F1-type ATP synthase membrane subunit b/b'
VNVPNLADPVFIAKVVDFVVFVIAVVYVYERFVKPSLVSLQEAQNKLVEDAVSERAASEAAVRSAATALERAEADARRMVDVGGSQAQRVIADERAAAEELARRLLAHAAGELERERYRVRRELLEETVERASAQAREEIRRAVGPQEQRVLMEGLIAGLERVRA